MQTTTDHSSYLERKNAELTENLSLLHTQITSASDQLQSVRREYEAKPVDGEENSVADAIWQDITRVAVQMRRAQT